jgi:hypothetical protein
MVEFESRILFHSSFQDIWIANEIVSGLLNIRPDPNAKVIRAAAWVRF